MTGIISTSKVYDLEQEREKLIEEWVKPNWRKRDRVRLNQIEEPQWGEYDFEIDDYIEITFKWMKRMHHSSMTRRTIY